jgi:FkbM family methyltransferase
MSADAATPAVPAIGGADVEWRMTRHGPLLYFSHDAYIGASLRAYGEFSELEFDMLRQLLGPGDTVVEVGANIGALTIPIARRVGPGGPVYAIEAQRRVFQVLCANVVLGGLPNVHTLLGAGTSQAAYLHVPAVDYSVPNNFGGIALGARPGAGESAQPIAIDDLDLAVCKLIKVDVEGMELDVLASGARTIGRCRPILYTENDRRRDSPALIQYIVSLGYRLWWHTPALFNPQNYAGNPANLFEHMVSLNMICVPAEIDFRFAGGAEVRGPHDYPEVGGTV